MTNTSLHALVAAGCVLLFSPDVRTRTDVEAAIRFAKPSRIKAGEAFLGDGRLYPSPAMHDVDGDGHADIVIGDLPGRVTWARHTAKPMTFETEKPLENREGKPLKFHNW